MDNTDELLTVAEVASALRINRTAVWAWRKSGHLPQAIDISPPGSRRPTLRFRRSDLLEFIGTAHE
jgi:predicted DNA-binding transcriptional regulator AlpA